MGISTVLTDRFDRALLTRRMSLGDRSIQGPPPGMSLICRSLQRPSSNTGGDKDLAIAALLHDSVEDQQGDKHRDPNDPNKRFEQDRKGQGQNEKNKDKSAAE